MSIDKVDIRPGVNILSMLRHLNYRPWYALAEFVDNSLQSYLGNFDALQAANGESHELIIKIDIDSSPPARISIKDNAAGINVADYERAFRPAEVPPDASGLSEFGMGMKSAACWFSPTWSVKTKALGEDVARRVKFDIENIVNDELSELSVEEGPMKASAHFTEVVLENLYSPTVGRTLSKIKEHLTDIYREFTRREDIQIIFNGEELTYKDPTILFAPYFKTPDEKPVSWKKEFAFDFGADLKVKGFAALRNPGSTSRAGFALFRRGRVIQGSGDECYRPIGIFGHSNSYRYQRLFGELHLQGFNVSHTKDGFKWDENEEPFIQLLRDELDSGDLPLLKQAEGYRSIESLKKITQRAGKAVDNTVKVMRTHLPNIFSQIADEPLVETSQTETLHKNVVSTKTFKFNFKDIEWEISVEATQDTAESQWLIFNDVALNRDELRRLDIRLNLAHPFVIRFGQSELSALEAQMRIGAALAMSEVLAKDGGIRLSGTFRRNVNEILTEVMSRP